MVMYRSFIGRALTVCAVTWMTLVLATPLAAGFTLLEERKESGGYEAVVVFEPDWALADAAAADRRLTLPVDDPELVELFSEPAPPADVSLFATSSFVLGLPEFSVLDAADWSVEPVSAVLEDGTRLQAFDVDASVTLLATRAGTVRSIQVVVDPTVAVPETDSRPVELVLRVTGPGVPARPKASTRPLDPKDTKGLLPLFLNEVAPGDVPSSLVDPSLKDAAEFPHPPGEYRLGYKDGEKVFRLPLAELGLSEADLGTIALKHHFEMIEIEPADPDEDPEFERREIILSIGGNSEDGYWFYAPRRHTLTDITDSVFVSLSESEPSPVVQTRPAFLPPADPDKDQAATPPSTEQAVWREVLHEYRGVYQRATPRPLGRRFVAHWEMQGNPNNGGDPREVTIPLRGELTNLEVVLTPVLLGINFTPINPDHYADLTLEGVALPRTSWNGRTEHAPEIPVTLDSAPENGELLLEHFVPTDSPAVEDGDYADVQALGEVILRYESYPRADSSGRLLLELPEEEVASRRMLTVGGLPEGTEAGDVLVLDVTTPRAPVELTGVHILTGSDGAPAVAFEAEPGRTRYFVAARQTIANPPVAVESETLPPLTGPGLQLRSIFVREPSMAAALEPLVTLHGPGTIEFTPQQAYNAFNGGQEGPEAIRDALAYYVLNAPLRTPFPNAILVGDGSLDRRNYIGNHTGAILPMFLDPSAPSGGISIETPVDMPYARLSPGNILLDVNVSRLPARTPAQLQRIVNRQAAYNDVVPNLVGRDRYGVFLNDYDAQVMADAALWPQMWEETGKPSIRIDFPRGSNGEAERAELAAAMTDEEAGGVAVFLYTGHGNNDRWGSNGRLMRNSHVSSFSTAGRWPLMATFTCLSAYYAFPTGSTTASMAETWILREGDGSIGTLAPATVDFYVEQKLLAMRWLEVLGSTEGRPDSWGETFTLGANSYLTSFPGLLRSANNYHYFGDPSAHATLNELPEELSLDGWMVW